MSQPPMEVSPGVLAVSHVKELFTKNKIDRRRCALPDFTKMDGSAFDIPLGRTAWELDHGVRPTMRELLKLRDNAKLVPLDSDGCFLFKKSGIYLIELDYHLQLPPNINGRATGKSSIGRLDVITRLLTDHGKEYDVIEAGYEGPLYLLVLPQTFSIKVAPGKSLNQIRLFSGPPYASIINKHIIRDYGTPFWHVPKTPVDSISPFEPWNEIIGKYITSQTADPLLFDLTVELADPRSSHIYEALSGIEEPIDLGEKDGSYDPKGFFKQTQINPSSSSPSVVLEQNIFYIMKSKERLYIPRDVAVEVVAISERIGDIRIHYAGFAHPGFGRHAEGTSGTPLIFEVRATDMRTCLYDGSLLAKIQLFRMSAETNQSNSQYDQQELKLSKVFAEWSEGSE